MSLATYTDLETQIATWLGRPGDTVVAASAPDYITLCEARLAYGSGDPDDADASLYTAPLRIRAMETTRTIPLNAVVSGNTVGGTANAIILTPAAPITSYAVGQTWTFPAVAANTGAVTVAISGLANRNLLKGSNLAPLVQGDISGAQNVQMYDDGTELIYLPGTASAPLPVNYLAARAAYLDTNPRIPVEYETPTQANLWVSSQWPDIPRKFTIEGDAIRLNPGPNGFYNFVLSYYMKFGALSAATNWLMTNAPNVYLFGSLLEASIALQMTDEYTLRYLRLFRAACNGVQAQDSNDRHSGGLLTIRNDTGNP